jgi:hypothetical protein
MAGSPRPAVSRDALAGWCLRWLGAAPAVEVFEAGFLSAVRGLRLTDGRQVVVKVRPDIPRLAGCAAVHRSLWVAGFPCAEPLVGLQPLGGDVASAESLIPGGDEPPSGDLAGRFAAALACLMQLAPDPASVPSLMPSPSWTGWDHDEPGPRPLRPVGRALPQLPTATEMLAPLAHAHRQISASSPRSLIAVASSALRRTASPRS